MNRKLPLVLHFCFAMLIGAIAGSHSLAQTFHFKNYSIDEGLGQTQVSDVFQDHNGIIWLGTNGGGLTRYNGQTFTVYTIENGLADNAVNDIFEDSDNNLWVCTANGISKWSDDPVGEGNGHFVNYAVSDGLADGIVWTVIQDQKGNLIFGTNEGLSILLNENEQKAGEKFRNTKLGLSHTIVRSILQDKNGVFWYGTENGLTRHDPNAASGELFSYYSTKDGLADDFIRSSFEDSQGNLWFGTDLGISRLISGDVSELEQKFENTLRVDGLRLSIIYDIVEDRKGNIWFAGWGGIGAIEYVPKFNAFRRLSKANGLADDNVISILEDNEGSLWFGTYGQGVSKFLGRRFETYTTDHGMADNFIWAVQKDLNQNLWIGGNLGGVTRMVRNRDPEKIGGYDNVIQQYGEQDGFPSRQVNSIEVDRAGNVWFCSENGLILLRMPAATFGSDGTSKPRLSFKHYTQASGLLKERPRTIYEDSRGSYWIAYTGGRVHRMTMQGGKAVFHKDVFKSELLNNFTIYAIHEDQRGEMWFGTAAGIVMLSINDTTGEVEREVNITTREGLVHNDVRSIVEDSEGNLWFGTGGGISKYNPYQTREKFENYTSKDGLISDRVYLLQLDGDRNLWIGTNMGMDVLDLENYLATKQKFDPEEYKYKSVGEINIRHFGYAEGFVGNETNTGASCKDEDGSLWLGSIAGVIRYNPKEDVINTVPPLTRIIGLDLFSSPVDLSTAFEFKHDENHYMFKYLGISHKHQEGVIYKHKLEGYSYKWSDPSTSTTVTYASLPVGTYKFSVMAANADGIWNETPISYSFKIVPPFWQSVWFYVLVILGIGALIYSIIKIRLKALEQTARALSEQVEIKTAKLKASETQYRSLFDNSGDSVFIYDKETHVFLDCNETAVSVYGYSKEEIKTMKPYDFHHNEEVEDIRKIMESKPSTAHIYEHYTKTNEKLYVEVKSSVITFDQKVAVLSIVRDVTARRADEKKIESINRQLTGSIRYSKRILDAILRSKSDIEKIHADSFILFKPKDIVSGDFYWFHKLGKRSIIAAIDCTGHGVAGAFMSLIGNEILDEVVKGRKIVDPGKILSEMHKAVVSTMKKGEKLGDAVGGMDVAICSIDYENDSLEFAGAGRPLVLVRDGVEMIYPGNKYPVGLVVNKEGKYSNVYMNERKSSNGMIKSEKIKILKGDNFYMFTDGYCDQFGGESGEKFMRERFSQLLVGMQSKSMDEQEKLLESTLADWQGEQPQVDDVLVIGLKI